MPITEQSKWHADLRVHVLRWVQELCSMQQGRVAGTDLDRLHGGVQWVVVAREQGGRGADLDVLPDDALQLGVPHVVEDAVAAQHQDVAWQQAYLVHICVVRGVRLGPAHLGRQLEGAVEAVLLGLHIMICSCDG